MTLQGILYRKLLQSGSKVFLKYYLTVVLKNEFYIVLLKNISLLVIYWLLV